MCTILRVDICEWDALDTWFSDSILTQFLGTYELKTSTIRVRGIFSITLLWSGHTWNHDRSMIAWVDNHFLFLCFFFVFWSGSRSMSMWTKLTTGNTSHSDILPGYAQQSHRVAMVDFQQCDHHLANRTICTSTGRISSRDILPRVTCSCLTF